MHLRMTGKGHPYHLTIIHAPGRRSPHLPGATLLAVPIVCQPSRVEVLGPAWGPVRAAMIDATDELVGWRRFAERALDALGIEWSRQWAFNPHVTIGDAPMPARLTFDTWEWV